MKSPPALIFFDEENAHENGCFHGTNTDVLQ